MKPRFARRLAGIPTVAAVAMWVLVGAASLAHAGNEKSSTPPVDLLERSAADATTLDRLFASFRSVTNFEANFQEEKKLTLLVRPLRSEGTLYFDREHGLVRQTTTPASRVQKLRLTEASLTLWNGTVTEEVKLEQSKDLSALALSFPRILRGDHVGLGKTFSIKMQGSDASWWALTLGPKDDSLKRMLSHITVIGQGALVHSVGVYEANGDRTSTTFTDVRKNTTKTAAETEALFRLP